MGKWTFNDWHLWNLPDDENRHLVLVTMLLRLNIDWSRGVRTEVFERNDISHVSWFHDNE